MPSKEEQFKAFLQSLSDERRQQLFEYLKKLPPEERNKAIDTMVMRLNMAQNSSNGTAPSPNQTGNVQPVQRPQQAQPLKRTTNPQAQQPIKSQVLKNQQVQSRPQMANPQHVQARPNATSRVNERPSEEQVSSRKTNTKRDILIVSIVLVLFIGLCLGIKVLLDKKLEEKPVVETTVETIATTVENVSLETTIETTETTEITPTPIPTPTNVPLKSDAPDLSGMIIVIDPGHQETTSSEVESVATWLSTTKKCATSGGVGKATGIPEYELTLDVSILLKDYLEQCGATVILTRETNDVDLSNQARANIATSNNASLFIRIHADQANDSYTSGVKVFVPDSGSYSSTNVSLGNSLGQKVADSVGLSFIGTKSSSLYTGLNYANSVPSFQISLGLLSNSDDEAILINEDNQVSICAAIAEFASEIKNN